MVDARLMGVSIYLSDHVRGSRAYGEHVREHTKRSHHHPVDGCYKSMLFGVFRGPGGAFGVEPWVSECLYTSYSIHTMGTQVRERSLGRLGADGTVSQTNVTGGDMGR